MKAKVTWILVADGAEAKVFEHSGPGKGLKPLGDLHFQEEPLQAREIMADKPGRAFTSGGQGAGRSGYEYSSDPVQVRERRFVERVAGEIEKHHQKKAFDQLIIAAAPTALGDLRPALSKQLRETVVAELPKDLTNIPNGQLESHFADLLPL